MRNSKPQISQYSPQKIHSNKKFDFSEKVELLTLYTLLPHLLWYTFIKLPQVKQKMTLNNSAQLEPRSNTLTIEYPQELLWALQKEPEEFAAEARVLLAIKLYETGKLSTGLAAQVAGVPRSAFSTCWASIISRRLAKLPTN